MNGRRDAPSGVACGDKLPALAESSPPMTSAEYTTEQQPL